jgi:hypothetical protein
VGIGLAIIVLKTKHCVGVYFCCTEDVLGDSNYLNQFSRVEDTCSCQLVTLLNHICTNKMNVRVALRNCFAFKLHVSDIQANASHRNVSGWRGQRRLDNASDGGLLTNTVSATEVLEINVLCKTIYMPYCVHCHLSVKTGFGLVIGFIDHLWVGITINYKISKITVIIT